MGGAKEKFRNILAAIHLLHRLQEENRLATSEEQEILSKYVGCGSFFMAFDEQDAAWENEYAELKEIMRDRWEITDDPPALRQGFQQFPAAVSQYYDDENKP